MTIKYRVKGSFLNTKGSEQKICSEFFQDELNPFNARERARNYFQNYVDLLMNEFNIDFEKTFYNKTKIELPDNTFEYETKYGLAVEFTFDEIEFFQIDYFGGTTLDQFDYFAYGLSVEFEYYLKNKFYYENSKKLTYYDKQEFEEGYSDEPDTFEILETSINFENKDEVYWWLSKEDKIKLIKSSYIDYEINKALSYGENSFIEFKPSLVYNFKTKKAAIGVKYIVAKVICSFLNSNGGKVIIGVNDDGNIQGLEHDFSLKTKDNEFDFFRLEFENLLYQFFDKSVYALIKADFKTDYDKPIFVISVQPSGTPVFLKKKDLKEFYIRTTTSSIEIKDKEEIVKYCFSHWRSDENKR